MSVEPAARIGGDSVELVLDDGAVALLRPQHHQETGPLLQVFDAMSERSRARRYLTGMPQLPPSLLRVLTDVGTREHVAWVATVGGTPVGIARYVAVDPTMVEVAFEVVDAHHRRGIGRALLDTIATVACANGFTSVSATVHPANRASVHMLRGIGLRLHPRDGLLEGAAPLRLLEPSRVDRRAVLRVLDRQAARPGSVLECELAC
jgi:GNAT superfamily N-acetyltransferase